MTLRWFALTQWNKDCMIAIIVFDIIAVLVVCCRLCNEDDGDYDSRLESITVCSLVAQVLLCLIEISLI